MFITAGQRTGKSELISRALTLVPPDSRQAGRLLLHDGFVTNQEEGNDVGAQEAFGRALSIARNQGDAALEMETLTNSFIVDLLQWRWREGLENGLRAIELTEVARNPLAESQARMSAPGAYSAMGNLQGAQTHGAACLALAESLRGRNWLTFSLWISESIARLGGD